MNDTLPTNARTLPLYEIGLAAGIDVGLVIALTAITAEVAWQDVQAVAAASDPNRQDGRTYAAASSAWLKVARVLAQRFRQEASR